MFIRILDTSMKVMMVFIVLSFTGTKINDAISAYNSKNYSEALVILTEVINEEPSTKAFYFRGLTYTKLTKPSEAFNDFKKAVELDNTNFDAMYYLGMNLYESKKYSDAIATFNNIPETNKSYKNALYFSGLAFQKSDNHKEAIEVFSKILIHSNTEIKLNLNRARSYASLKQYDNAIADLNLFISQTPNDLSSRKLRADCFLKANRTNEAVEDLKHILLLDDRNTEAYYNLLAISQKANNNAEVKLYKDKLIALGVNDPKLMLVENATDNNKGKEVEKVNENGNSDSKVYFNKGLQAYNTGKYAEAQGYILNGLQLNPNDFELLDLLCKSYIRQSKFNEVIQYISPKTHLRPVELGYYKAYSLYKLDRIAEAEVELLKIGKPDMKNTEVFMLAGLIKEKQEKYEEAESFFQKIYEFQPTHMGANLELGNVYFYKKDYTNSAKHYLYVYDVKKKECGFLNNYAISLSKVNRVKEASIIFSDLVKTCESMKYEINYAVFLKTQGHFAESEAFFHKALAKDSTNNACNLNLGILALKNDNYNDALMYLSRLENRLLNDEELVCYNKGICYQNVAQIEQAVTYYTKALEISPGNDSALAARGACYILLKKHDLALEDFSKALLKDPTNSSYLTGRGIVYNHLRKFDLAIVDLTNANKLNNNSYDINYALGYANLNLGRKKNLYRFSAQASNIDKN